MKVIRSGEELRAELRTERELGRSIGFVPTMGALHDGHLSLVSLARDTSDVVILSIFVNPLQFGPTEDLDAYPRREREDLRLAEEAKVDVVFIPAIDEIYPAGHSTTVDPGPLGAVLEGRSRPGHFSGVATVVTTLFGLVAPDRAFFGQKDAQQVAVIQRVVADLAIPVQIIVGPTVREPDGLALSSRNGFLTLDDRARATVLHRALKAGATSFAEGGPAAAEEVMTEVVAATSGVTLDYARAVDPRTFEAPGGDVALLLIAVRVGTTRLIDNLRTDERGTSG